jgi:2-haloacid dehalogenase
VDATKVTEVRMKALVFDVYGTLYDVGSLVDQCRGLVPEPEAFVATWRAKQLDYAFWRSLMGRYADFWQVTQDALRYALKRHGVTVPAEEQRQLMDAWLHLHPYPEVRATLAKLNRYLRLVLSNGSPVMLETLLHNTGLQTEFEAVLSVDAVKIYKPAPPVYELALRRVRCAPAEIGFVSANGFDVMGAKAFGFTVYWVNRTGVVLEELGMTPDAMIRSLDEVTALIGQAD